MQRSFTLAEEAIFQFLGSSKPLFSLCTHIDGAQLQPIEKVPRWKLIAMSSSQLSRNICVGRMMFWQPNIVPTAQIFFAKWLDKCMQHVLKILRNKFIFPPPFVEEDEWIFCYRNCHSSGDEWEFWQSSTSWLQGTLIGSWCSMPGSTFLGQQK